MDSKLYYRQWYQKNKKKLAEKRKEYREDNRELINNKAKASYSAAHPKVISTDQYIEKRKVVVNQNGQLEEQITIKETPSKKT